MADYTNEELDALLPDYLNNNLPIEQRDAVRHYVHASELASSRLQNLQAVFAELARLEAAEGPVIVPCMAAIMAHVEAHPSKETGRHWWSFLVGAPGAWAKPALSAALIVIVAQAALLFQPKGVGTSDETVRGVTPFAESERVLVIVAFRAQASEELIRNLLLSVHARFAGGPSGDMADYILSIPAAQADQAIVTIRKSDIVLSVSLAPVAGNGSR